MTAQILVVDDVPANVKLLEARLTSEYYAVLTARDGYEGLKVTKEKKPDLILLDVMMPGIDGFETCRQIKADPDISHIPVVMVTALSEQSDRIRGLDAGADDFLTKPINDIALLARVRSLVRIKVLLDELRLRDKTSAEMGVKAGAMMSQDVSGSKILLIDDDPVQTKQIATRLEEAYEIKTANETDGVSELAVEFAPDAILISTMMIDEDGIRLAAQMKGNEELRHVPILMLVDEDDEPTMVKVLEMGFNDYLRIPLDKNEMVARLRTQIRRKKYQEMLRSNYRDSVSMAITDALTGLYNRHYMNNHMNNLVEHAKSEKRQMVVMMMDLDHFKEVNDTYGHDAGDAVLKQVAGMIIDQARSTDLVARFGGEEFVVLLPDTGYPYAKQAAERLRKSIEDTEFTLPNGQKLSKTISIGVTSMDTTPGSGETAENMLKRADEALYDAKNTGRNKVCEKLPLSAARA